MLSRTSRGGKTTIATILAGGQEYLRTVIGSRTEKSELLGGLQLDADRTYWKNGVLVECVKEGLFFLADEIVGFDNDCLRALHSLLDHRKRVFVTGDGQEIEMHPNFRFLASCNYSNAGMDPLPREFRDRFTYVYIERLSSEMEAKLLMDRYAISDEDAQFLVSYANATRHADPRNGASTRQLEAAARAVVAGIDRVRAASDCILAPIAGCSLSQREVLLNAVRAEGLDLPKNWHMKATTESVVVTEDDEVWS